MVKLNRVAEGIKADKILVKLEMQNPGGSVKDRIAGYMIEQAEARGEITPGKTTIIEGTSGNTGIGLAMVCAAKGYKCIICVPQMASMTERCALLPCRSRLIGTLCLTRCCLSVCTGPACWLAAATSSAASSERRCT
jgi:cysteine synthase